MAMNEANFIAGWVGGLCVTTVFHPFDSIKIHSQVTHLTAPKAALNLWMDNGLRAFYRGIASPMVGFGAAYALKFGVYGTLLGHFTRERMEQARIEYEEEIRRRKEAAEADLTRLQRRWRDLLVVAGLERGDVIDGINPDDLSAVMKNAGQVPFHQSVLCAAAGGAAFATVMTPFEVVKLRLVTESIFEHREYAGVVDCARQLYLEGGIPKLWLGYSATLLRDIPAAVVFFGTYGLLRGALLPASHCTAEDAPASLFAGACAGAATWTTVMPLDTIKTHMQASKRCQNEGWLCFARQLYMRGGWRHFYAGFTPALLRASCAQAICMTGVETALRFSKVFQGVDLPSTPTGARNNQGVFPYK